MPGRNRAEGRMEIVEREFEPTEVDLLRLGLREDRAIA